MKIIKNSLVIIVCFLFFSCWTEENPGRFSYYTKSYFIDENSFTFEGEIYHPNGSGTYESVKARIKPNTYLIEQYEGWEISGVKLPNNKFRIEINKTANGVTIDENMITSDLSKTYINWASFPDDFPVIKLIFCFDDANYHYEPYFRELRYYSKTEYDYFGCDYLYVAEPIDLSGTIIFEGESKLGYIVDTYYNDLDFSKPGWYKVVSEYKRKFENDPKFSSTTNNYFYF